MVKQDYGRREEGWGRRDGGGGMGEEGWGRRDGGGGIGVHEYNVKLIYNTVRC